MFVDAVIPLRTDDLVHIPEQERAVVELDLHSIETTIPGELNRLHQLDGFLGLADRLSDSQFVHLVIVVSHQNCAGCDPKQLSTRHRRDAIRNAAREVGC